MNNNETKKEEKRIIYAGVEKKETLNVSLNLNFDLDLLIKKYEIEGTGEVVSADLYTSADIEYDAEDIENQIKKQIIASITKSLQERKL